MGDQKNGIDKIKLQFDGRSIVNSYRHTKTANVIKLIRQ